MKTASIPEAVPAARASPERLEEDFFYTYQTS